MQKIQPNFKHRLAPFIIYIDLYNTYWEQTLGRSSQQVWRDGFFPNSTLQHCYMTKGVPASSRGLMRSSLVEPRRHCCQSLDGNWDLHFCGEFRGNSLGIPMNRENSPLFLKKIKHGKLGWMTGCVIRRVRIIRSLPYWTNRAVLYQRGLSGQKPKYAPFCMKGATTHTSLHQTGPNLALNWCWLHKLPEHVLRFRQVTLRTEWQD